jgi:hypothetical protein
MKWSHAIAIAAVGALALGGTMSDVLPRLSEGIVMRMLPVMRADAEQYEGAEVGLRELTGRLDEHQELMAAIDSGAIDPLAWLTSKSTYLITPASAVYQPELSRWVSSSYFFEPVAVFSFGARAPSPVLSADSVSGSAGGPEVKAVENEVERFYLANKFTNNADEFSTLGMLSPDSSVVVMLESTNMFAGLDASAGVPNGPMLWLWLASGAGAAADTTTWEEDSVGVSKGVEEALVGAGMTFDDYQSFLGALAMARDDAADPFALDLQMDTSFVSVDETAKDMLEFNAIRKANVRVYRKLADKVDSLLTSLGK